MPVTGISVHAIREASTMQALPMDEKQQNINDTKENKYKLKHVLFSYTELNDFNIYSRKLNIIKYIYTLRVSKQSNICLSVTPCITFMATATGIEKFVNLNSLSYLITYAFGFFIIILTLKVITLLIKCHADNAAALDVNHSHSNMQ